MINYTTQQIFSITPQLEIFMTKCKELGYTNNETAKSMKFNWCLENGGSWWATIKNDQIISVSGAHLFLDGYRALFRGAQIEPRPYDSLNKYQLQNYAFVYHLDKQITWANNKPIYITTSAKSDLDRSGKMSRVHKSAVLLAKQNVFEFVKTEIVYYVEQTIWKLNVEKYYEIRK